MFQTSNYWVKINREIIAIRGSFYGILISVILCAVVVAVLSNNGPVVLAMGLTILGILVTLLGLFKLFGWTLGIIEAISLSILVGNSLDYCIHLSEGYLATDQRHLTFLKQFKVSFVTIERCSASIKTRATLSPPFSLSLPPSSLSLSLPPSPPFSLQFTHTATDRVKRVLSAISFIGVSILSSALTTILATLPLLAAKILLFTRFGQILILDTAVAIIYTLVFCSTFLSLFGPLGGGSGTKRVLNGCVTITATVVLMAALYGVATEVMSHYNII